MKHRSDIDGLRAVAVIAVVLFHTRLVRVPGGFVGADIFFVISGYLITTLLLEDIRKERFSIANFYERRVRRILPALFAVLLFSSVAAYAILLPRDAKDYGRSLAATVFFSSNRVFAGQAGYFDAPGEMKPLLHTWSLAVEGQFYIVYPLFLFVVTRYFRKRYAIAIGLVLILSFAISVRRLGIDPPAAFYFIGARAWELMLGGLLATAVIPELRHGKSANILGLFGLGLIGYSVFALSSATPFPGPNALYPCVGAALIIYSGIAQETLVSRVLSVRPVVFVGLISYSLYLWHWVILVFSRYYLVRSLNRAEAAAVMASAFVLASLSWQFIETPFRRREAFRSQAWLFSGAAAATLLMGTFGAVANVRNGMPNRFRGDARTLMDGAVDVWKRRYECQRSICPVGSADARESFILWGDSHAGALAPALERVALAHNASGFIAFHPACAPLLRLKRYDRSFEDCGGFNDSVLEYIKTHPVRTVFLHARWAIYSEGQRYKQEPGGPALLARSLKWQDDNAAFNQLVHSTLAELKALGPNVVIVASAPEVGVDVPTELARAYRSRMPLEIAPLLAEFMERQRRAFEVLRSAAAEFSAQIVYPHEMLCETSRCLVVKDQRPFYSDEHHLSVHGAMYLAPMIEKLLTTDLPTGSSAGAGNTQPK
jgi:peptidoglycan/LPS O-acetylase OafA/YrhL